MNKVLVILGPTATGKTDLAIVLAKKFNGEIISADSRQVYIGLDIGTGKLPSGSFKLETGSWKKQKGFWEIDGVKIWMYDVLKPNKQYTVYDYVKDAGRMVREITERGKLPIIVGGTGFYLKVLLEGLPNLDIPPDLKLRRKLTGLSLEELQKKLQKLFLKRWEKMNFSDRQNPRRLIRAIELSLSSSRLPRHFVPRNDVLWIGLTAPRKILYDRADERVIDRIDQGMIKEAKKLYEKGLSLKRMRELGLEYGVLADYLSGKIRKIKGDFGLIRIMQNKIHGYVRRQLTWFKNPSTSSGYIRWFDITEKNYIYKVENLVAKWYYQTNAS